MENKGFTLIEAVITIVVVSIIGYIVFAAVSTGVKAYLITDQRKEALDSGRIAMERITRELRGMREFTGMNNATPAQVCFTSMDGPRISFRYSNQNIIRNADWTACPYDNPSDGSILASGITSFTFSYIQNSGAVDASPPAATRRIRINLTSTAAQEQVVQESEVFLRNK